MAELEYPEQSYFPSAKVRLVLRFEEFADGKVNSDAQQAITKAPTKLKGINDNSAPLVAVQDPDAPAGVTRWAFKPKQGVATATGPQQQDTSADEYTHVIGSVIPRSAKWGANGVRQADTLALTFKYIDLPFDPRCIRSAAVEFYLGTVPADEYSRGLAGETRIVTTMLATGMNVDEEPLNVVPDEYVDPTGQQRTNQRFQGWVDTWDVEWDDAGEPTVKLDCRDNVSLLIDQDSPPQLHIDPAKPVDEAVANYLANFPQFLGLKVQYLPVSEKAPTLGDALSKSAFQPQQGPPPGKGAAPAQGAQKNSVWDYLTDVTGMLGLILRLEGTTVIIQRARTLMGSQYTVRPDDPYQPRDLPSGRAEVRRFIYGRNIASMRFGRKYAKSKTQNIEVRCYLPRRKKTLTARYPVKGQALHNASPGDGKSQSWLVFRVSGIEDEAVLQIVAQTLYDSIGRNELAMSIKTRNLSSFGGGNLDPDVLDMKAGDPFEVLVNRDEDEFNSFTVIENLLAAQQRAEQFLQVLGYSGELASAYAKSYASVQLPTVFRLKALGVDWSIDDGVELNLQGINYITVRMEKDDVSAGKGGQGQ